MRSRSLFLGLATAAALAGSLLGCDPTEKSDTAGSSETDSSTTGGDTGPSDCARINSEATCADTPGCLYTYARRLTDGAAGPCVDLSYKWGLACVEAESCGDAYEEFEGAEDTDTCPNGIKVVPEDCIPERNFWICTDNDYTPCE